MKSQIFALLLFVSANAIAENDKKEVLQDLICEVSGFSQSIRDGVPSQKTLQTESVNVKVERSIEQWNKNKKDINITMTPRGDGKIKFEYLAILGRYSKDKKQSNVWYENTDDTYEITETDDGNKAPNHLENIKIDRLTGNIYFRKATIGSYSAVLSIQGKCIPKEKARVLN